MYAYVCMLCSYHFSDRFTLMMIARCGAQWRAVMQSSVENEMTCICLLRQSFIRVNFIYFVYIQVYC